MAKIRSKFTEPMDVPGYGVVEPDAVLTVSDDDVFGFTCQESWEAVDKAASVATDDGESATAEAVAAEVVAPDEPGDV